MLVRGGQILRCDDENKGTGPLAKISGPPALVDMVTDRELLDIFTAVEQLNDRDQTMVKTFIDALVTKRRVQALA